MRVLTPEVERVSDSRAKLGESAIWYAPQNALLWVDIVAGKVLRTRLDTGRTDAWDFPEKTGFVQPCDDGTWLVGQHAGIARLDPSTGEARRFAELEPAGSGNRTNDAACDRQGRLWVGTMPRPDVEMAPAGCLYRVESDGGVSTVDRGLHIPNGIAFSPDGRTAYWADTFKTVRQVWKAPYDPQAGTVGHKTPFIQTAEGDGRPDGAAVDASGCYWVAAVGGWRLLRFTPAGGLDLVVRLPIERPTKLAFGGSDLKTIFITSISDGMPPEAAMAQPLAGCLLALDIGIEGLPATLFRTRAVPGRAASMTGPHEPGACPT